jgi:hypothetical protein
MCRETPVPIRPRRVRTSEVRLDDGNPHKAKITIPKTLRPLRFLRIVCPHMGVMYARTEGGG